jgi:hypothetical protein
MRIFLIGCIGAVLLASPPSQAKSSACVDSLAGKVEIQRAGAMQWTAVKKGDALFNNDVVRAGDAAFARLDWSDGSTVFLHQNSQLLINLYESDASKLLTRHLTLFFGAAYFIIKKVLPQTGPSDIKIFTPTAIVAIRGTSFSLDVDKTDGSTNCKLLSGTILIRNILKSAASIITPGFQTTVALNADPAAPSSINESDILGLKKWVPAAIIDNDISFQYLQDQRERMTMEGQIEKKVVVIPPVNNSAYAGGWDISAGMGAAIAAALSTPSAPPVSVKGAAQSDPAKTGLTEKARYVVAGGIAAFDVSQRARITTQADKYSEFAVATVGLHLQLYDILEQKVLVENTWTGESEGPISQQSTFRELGKLPFDMKNAQFSRSILGKAIAEAVRQAAEEMNGYIGSR